MKSWLDIDPSSDFSIHNIPFGIIRTGNRSARVATRIGDYVIDLAALTDLGFLQDLGIDDFGVFKQDTLNDFISLGKPVTGAVRLRLQELLTEGANTKLRNNKTAIDQAILSVDEVQNLLPVRIGDYTDFYSSIEHATNVGMMFRDPENALLPNWRHLPVGYHGRSSSIVVSGTPIHRPKGQTLPPNAEVPVFGPSKRLDFELEVAFITGRQTTLGSSVPVDQAEDYIFGLVLFNDLSARDIQKWEYVPLGPFLAKNFGSPISAWIVTLEALEPFRVQPPEQAPEVLPYLRSKGLKNYDIQLEVFVKPEKSDLHKVSTSNFKYMYWNMCQQLAHQTVNGCNINVGDMYASGTISGHTPDSYGSLLELTWSGKNAIQYPDGVARTFLEDNDTVVIKGFAQRDGVRVGFGEVSTLLLPATE